MSDLDPSPVALTPVAPMCDEAVRAALTAYDTLNAASRDANKVALFAALAAAGITQVVVEFDGYGDSGQIENIEAMAGDAVVALPDVTVTIAIADWGQAEAAPNAMSVAEAVERLAYAFLGETHGGWENNDGAYGDFVFDVAASTISLEYHERYTATESYAHEF